MLTLTMPIDLYLQTEFQEIENAGEEIQKIRNGQGDEQTTGGDFSQRWTNEGEQTGDVPKKTKKKSQRVSVSVEVNDQWRIDEQCIELI